MSTTMKNEYPATKSEQLEGYKEQVMKDVHKVQGVLNDKVDVAKKSYLDPAQDFIFSQVRSRPLASSLVGIFVALSFLPIVTFILFSVGAILVVGGTALVISLVILGFALGVALAFLLGTLFVTAFLSVGGLVWGLSLYATYRLAQNLRMEPSIIEGLKTFDIEMRGLLFGGGAQGRGKKIVD